MRAFSIMALTEPWGEWQVVQPSRTASCSKHKRTALGGVALVADFVFGRQLGRAAACVAGPLCGLWQSPQLNFALRHRMMIRQGELGPLVQVASEAVFRGAAGIDDGLALRAGHHVRAARTVVGAGFAIAGGLDVQAAGAMAGLATHVDRVRSLAIDAGWVAVLKSRVMFSWHWAQAAEPTKVAPGICGGTTSVTLSSVTQETITTASHAAAAAIPARAESHRRQPTRFLVVLSCSRINPNDELKKFFCQAGPRPNPGNLPITAPFAAWMGFSVSGVDIDPRRIESIKIVSGHA